MRKIDLGVVIVTFNSGDEAVDCLESLLSSGRAAEVGLHVAVVDNASTDDTVAKVRDWASGRVPYASPDDLPFALTLVPKPLPLIEGGPDLGAGAAADTSSVALIQTGVNWGFAGGVNAGLAYLAQFAEVRHFWVLNPDSVVAPEAVGALARRLGSAPIYSLMGGRVIYLDPSDQIQIDGGLVNRFTGITSNLNRGRTPETTPPPSPADMDFITGSSMVASRSFYEKIGPMREDYFLYYEEVDWAMRRGDLPLAYCEGLRVFHRGGTAIGSPVIGRAASPFSLYFKHRGRILFLRRFFPRHLPVGYAYSLAYAARMLAGGATAEAWAVLSGSFGLEPPAAIRRRLGKAAGGLAFAPVKA